MALAFLAILFTSIIGNGWTAFFQTSIELPITFDAQEIDPDGARSESALAQANYQKLAYTALYKVLGVDPASRASAECGQRASFPRNGLAASRTW